MTDETPNIPFLVFWFVQPSSVISSYSVLPYSGARSARSIVPLLYKIVVTHRAEKIGLDTVRVSLLGATFSMRG